MNAQKGEVIIEGDYATLKYERNLRTPAKSYGRQLQIQKSWKCGSTTRQSSMAAMAGRLTL